MTDLLSFYDDFPISKSTIHSMENILDQPSDIIRNFLDGSFKPPLMQQPFIVPWPDKMNEFIYASTTSLIDNGSVIDSLQKLGYLHENDLDFLKQTNDSLLKSMSVSKF